MGKRTGKLKRQSFLSNDPQYTGASYIFSPIIGYDSLQSLPMARDALLMVFALDRLKEKPTTKCQIQLECDISRI